MPRGAIASEQRASNSACRGVQKSVFAQSTTASKGAVPSGRGANMSASSIVPSTRSRAAAANSAQISTPICHSQ